MKCFSKKKSIANREEILVHGGIKYQCEKCGATKFMCLEIGVEDHGKNGRPHQPSPFLIPCSCGGRMKDISGYLPLPTVRPLLPGMHYFAYDKSGSDNACGKPSVYQPSKKE